jgi:hypothetical protein
VISAVSTGTGYGSSSTSRATNCFLLSGVIEYQSRSRSRG